MQLDVYRNQELERLLIVKQGTVIKRLEGLRSEFLNALVSPDQVDSEVGRLPKGINREEVLEAINSRGYFWATCKFSLKEIDL